MIKSCFQEWKNARQRAFFWDLFPQRHHYFASNGMPRFLCLFAAATEIVEIGIHIQFPAIVGFAPAGNQRSAIDDAAAVRFVGVQYYQHLIDVVDLAGLHFFGGEDGLVAVNARLTEGLAQELPHHLHRLA